MIDGRLCTYDASPCILRPRTCVSLPFRWFARIWTRRWWHGMGGLGSAVSVFGGGLIELRCNLKNVVMQDGRVGE